MSLRQYHDDYIRQLDPFKHPPIQEDPPRLNSTPPIEPIFYADTQPSVNIQLSVAEENFYGAPSVMPRG
jgi:hypothetical protein